MAVQGGWGSGGLRGTLGSVGLVGLRLRLGGGFSKLRHGGCIVRSQQQLQRQQVQQPSTSSHQAHARTLSRVRSRPRLREAMSGL